MICMLCKIFGCRNRLFTAVGKVMQDKHYGCVEHICVGKDLHVIRWAKTIRGNKLTLICRFWKNVIFSIQAYQPPESQQTLFIGHLFVHYFDVNDPHWHWCPPIAVHVWSLTTAGHSILYVKQQHVPQKKIIRIFGVNYFCKTTRWLGETKHSVFIVK